MSKILIVKGIKTCNHCPMNQLNNIELPICFHSEAPEDSNVYDGNTIPTWCPLPDEKPEWKTLERAKIGEVKKVLL